MPEMCMLPYNTDKRSGFQLGVQKHYFYAVSNSYISFSFLDRRVLILSLAYQGEFVRRGNK